MSKVGVKYDNVPQQNEEIKAPAEQARITILLSHPPGDDEEQMDMLQTRANSLRDEIQARESELKDVISAIRADAWKVMDRATYTEYKLKRDRFQNRMLGAATFVGIVCMIVVVALVGHCNSS